MSHPDPQYEEFIPEQYENSPEEKFVENTKLQMEVITNSLK